MGRRGREPLDSVIADAAENAITAFGESHGFVPTNYRLLIHADYINITDLEQTLIRSDSAAPIPLKFS